MAGYRRVKNSVTSEDGETSVIVGQEGLKVPSVGMGRAAQQRAERENSCADETNCRAEKLTVGQVTKLTGVPATKLRHYEEKGLLHPECTGEGVSNNRRLYGVEDLERLQAVLTLVEYGFGLSEIRQLLDDREVDLYEAIALKLEELKRQEARLRALILFTKFVDITDDADLIEGLACGPASLDALADLARGLPAYEQAMQRLDAYSEEEAATALECVTGTIEELMLMDEIKGFAGVEDAVGDFFAWWNDFVAPADKLGYLGFWAVFEDQSLIAEYVEAIGGAGDAATLQMLTFFVMLTRFMCANDAEICEIAQLADSDIVAAIERARVLSEAAGIVLLGAPDEREAAVLQMESDVDTPSNVLAELCYSLLVFAGRVLEDEWLSAYLGIDQGLSSKAETVENALRVIDVMCDE